MNYFILHPSFSALGSTDLLSRRSDCERRALRRNRIRTDTQSVTTTNEVPKLRYELLPNRRLSSGRVIIAGRVVHNLGGDRNACVTDVTVRASCQLGDL